ncbi:MAG: hypothetical protein ACK4RK_05705 [Gemmataceae bacterium]
MDQPQLTRRELLGGAVAGVLLSGARPRAAARDQQDRAARYLYWGDLHNHNAVGYGQGSLERAIAVARAHLDFFAFTGHASWHDMPKMPGDRHMKWVHGFEAHTKHWPKTRQLLREANADTFVALLGYEWHSSEFGDYCVLFAEDQPELYLPDHVNKLLDFAAAKKALAIPHHVGYKQGWRGANFSFFRPSVSPVVEIFSEHGCTESDRAPFPMLRHSNGGRATANTIQRQLERGLRFGFVASSDNHRGYPGAHGEGVLGVWARDLSAPSLFEAIRARRTYAATGDRIALDVTLNDHPMGAEVKAGVDRQIDVQVEGQDALAMIELVRNGRVIDRYFPEDHIQQPFQLPGRVRCRIQYGWGPWAALNLGRICEWDMMLTITGGKFLSASPCFQSAPYDEQAIDQLRVRSDTEIHLHSFTSRVDCFAEDPTKAVVVEIDAGADAVLTLSLRQPARQTVSARVADLIEDNVVTFTGGFTTESHIIHRLVFPSEFTASIRWHDRRPGAKGTDWYYVRVTQHNGHMVWSSPLWVTAGS